MEDKVKATLTPVEFVTRSSEVRQIALDIESVERKIRQSEAEGRPKAEVTELWMDVVTRKNEYKLLSGLAYITPLDASRKERKALQVL